MRVRCEAESGEVQCVREDGHDGHHCGPWHRDDHLPDHCYKWADPGQDTPFRYVKSTGFEDR